MNRVGEFRETRWLMQGVRKKKNPRKRLARLPGVRFIVTAYLCAGRLA